MMKFFQKMDKNQFLVMFAAFLWILICNIIVQFLHGPLSSIGIPGWTIFLANVLFFIKGNPKHMEGLLENACGAIFGLIGAMGLIYLNIWFAGMGASTLLATIIAIAIFLFLTIAIHPLVPYVFNNMALCFFLVALINEETQTALIANPWSHFAGVILGNGIVNVGTILAVSFVTKRLAKK
ncbi:MAG: hypothetical protein IJJ17_02730 [Parasporobacterium sp.]|nr:hypothetical protein [Parasporobacterium sp.]